MTVANVIIGLSSILTVTSGGQLTLLNGVNYGTINATGGHVLLGPNFQNQGTILTLSPTPQLEITQVGQNILLSWPTNFTGFTLQTSTNLS
jgi:hypothetical protein